MKVAVAGGSGFVGEALVREFTSLGDVVVLSRNPSKVREGRGVQWNPPAEGPWRDEVADADVVMNLAGDNIGSGRWTESKKQKMVASRLQSTRALVDVIRERRKTGRVLINASAVGYYGSRGDEILDENSPPGSDFLADLCKEWEAAARHAEGSARVSILRFGVVLGPGGGALPKMALPFRLFAGGPIGRGDQWLSWVDRRDLVRAVRWVIDQSNAKGVFNVTSPNPVRNRDFAKTLGSVLRRPAFMPAPAPALRLALGQMADEMLLASQRAVPRRLEEQQFRFEYPELRPSLENALR